MVSHTSDNYGYRETERWEVHNLPRLVSPAQQATVQRLASETRRYFVGPGACWDTTRVGEVVFRTPYRRDFAGEEEAADEAMRASFPIDISLYETRCEEGGAIVVGPHGQSSQTQTAMAAAFERAQARRSL